jgi:hypothetical protein
MAPSPKQAPRLGDIPSPADLARRTDRMDDFSIRLGRVEAKIDHLTSLIEKSLPKAAKR